MALNIKNEEVHRLVEELAHLTGETQTQAVKTSVEERIKRLRVDREGRLVRLRKIARECAAALDPEFKAMSLKEIDDMLYDENGLPR